MSLFDEDGFLRAIQANPTDGVAKLAYADWLDEHGEAEKAEYLRLVGESGWSPHTWKDRRGRVNARVAFLHTHLRGNWWDFVHGRVPLWDAVTLRALGQLEGALGTYASLGDHEADISYNLTARLVRRTGPIADMAPAHFDELTAPEVGVYAPVTAVPMDDWETDVRGVLDEWLFMELRHTRNGHSRLAFLSDQGRERIVGGVMDRIRAVIAPAAGWRIHIAGDRFYALDWADIVLESADRVLWLHFSFSD